MAAEFLNQWEFNSQKQLTYDTSALPWISHRELKLDGAIGHFAEPL